MKITFPIQVYAQVYSRAGRGGSRGWGGGERTEEKGTRKVSTHRDSLKWTVVETTNPLHPSFSDVQKDTY